MNISTQLIFIETLDIQFVLFKIIKGENKANNKSIKL